MAEETASEVSVWSLYIIQCADASFYIGITTDVARRFSEHQASGPKSAKYLRGRGPLQLVFQTEIGDRSLASKYEYACKQLSRSQKRALIAGDVQIHKIIDC